VEDRPSTILLIGESDLGEPTQAILTQPPDPSAGALFQTTCCEPSSHDGPPLAAGALVTSPDDAVVFVPSPGVNGEAGNFSFRVRDASGRLSAEVNVLLRVFQVPDPTIVETSHNLTTQVQPPHAGRGWRRGASRRCHCREHASCLTAACFHTNSHS
jgi:hypothetical protein